MIFILGNAGADSWIGLKRSGESYAWSDGNPTDFSNWKNSEGSKECVYMEGDNGEWVDDSCTTARRFLCKTEESKHSSLELKTSVELTSFSRSFSAFHVKRRLMRILCDKILKSTFKRTRLVEIEQSETHRRIACLSRCLSLLEN